MASKKRKPVSYYHQLKKEKRKANLQETTQGTKKKVKVKPPRQKNWLQNGRDFDDLDYNQSERVMPPGEAERRRKSGYLGDPIAVSGHTAAPAARLQGRVVAVAGAAYRVDLNGKLLTCTLRGGLKEFHTGYSNLVAVGDHVSITPGDDAAGVIEAVLPRRGVLARPSSSNRHLQQIIAANVDQVLIVAAWRQPNFWPELVDRYLVTALRNQLQAILCINKVDLVEDQSQLRAALQPYRDIDLPVLLTSATQGTGMAEVKARLKAQTTVLAGLSGAGKTSLLNAVQPGLHLPTNQVGMSGTFANQGRHTTTSALLLPLHDGGAVIDTPGIRSFGLAGLYKSDLAAFYPEFVVYASLCKYSNCTHTQEPQCAVIQGIADGSIAPMRYENYLKIVDTLPGSQTSHRVRQ